RQLLHHPTQGSQSSAELLCTRQGREGHQFPRTHDVRAGHLSIKRERQQRYQHRVLRRYDWARVPERECDAWYWPPCEWRLPAGDAAVLLQSQRRSESAEPGDRADQYVRPRWLSNNAGEEPGEPHDGRLSIRYLVRRCEDCLHRRRRTGRGRGYVRRLAEMGLQPGVLDVGEEVRAAAGVKSLSTV